MRAWSITWLTRTSPSKQVEEVTSEVAEFFGLFPATFIQGEAKLLLAFSTSVEVERISDLQEDDTSDSVTQEETPYERLDVSTNVKCDWVFL